jgi:hypothetical protein
MSFEGLRSTELAMVKVEIGKTHEIRQVQCYFTPEPAKDRSVNLSVQLADGMAKQSRVTVSYDRADRGSWYVSVCTPSTGGQARGSPSRI